MKEMSVTEQLMYVTTRVEGIKRDNTSFVATAFFCRLYLDEDKYFDVLVSNRHVLENLKVLSMHLCYLDDKEEVADDYFTVKHEIGESDTIISHPDPNVDLSILLIKSLMTDVHQRTGRQLFNKHIDSNHFADFSTDKYDAVEDVYMVGYPNGIWDDKNNRPIFRRGITATDPKTNYKGRSEFIIDCACVEGSSGSPVFSIRKGVMLDKRGHMTGKHGEIVELMGIQYAIPIKNMVANVEVIKDTADTQVARMQIPLNLGYIIKVDKLRDFIPILQELVKLSELVNNPALVSK